MNYYPTDAHRRAAETTVEILSQWPEVEAVVLTCSCARGKASKDSCLDMIALVRPDALSARRSGFEDRWGSLVNSVEAFTELARVGAYSNTELDFTDGCFEPRPRDYCSGPDSFELEIGNAYAYTVPLWERSSYFRDLRSMWLPYYGEDLRRQRLAKARFYCLNNLDHIPVYVERGLYFQSFKRLYDATREFMQATFIARRTYPIAYDKWIREQFVEILRLPEVYRELVRIMEIRDFESHEIADKAETLRFLLDQYTQED